MTGPRHVAVPRVLQVGPGVITDLGRTVVEHFDVSETIIVSGASRSAVHAEAISEQLQDRGASVRRVVDPGGATSAVTELVESIDQRRATLVIAVGGGRPVDVAKLGASRAHVDLLVVPTVLSHDGLCSPVASLIAGDGRRRSLPAITPSGVIIDTGLIADAPERYLQAGVGDLVSNLTALADWRLAVSHVGEPIDELAVSMALTGALSILDLDWPPSNIEVETVARGLMISGISMEIAKSSRPCSGAEHLISHALDAFQPGDRLHGEQVAVGPMIAARAHSHEAEERIGDLFERIGVLDRARNWIASVDLVSAVGQAPGTRPSRYTVLDEMDERGLTAAGLVDSLMKRIG